MFADSNLDECRALVQDLLPADASDDELSACIYDALDAEGELLFSLEWDSGGPGAGAGIECIYRLRGHYFFQSLDFGLGGPFATFEDPVEYVVGMGEDGSIPVNSATREITCSIWGVDELVQRLDLAMCEAGFDLVLNGESFRLEVLGDGTRELRRIPDAGEPQAGGTDRDSEPLAGQIGWLCSYSGVGRYVLCLECGREGRPKCGSGSRGSSEPLHIESVLPQSQRCARCGKTLVEGILPGLPERYPRPEIK